jgi:hypothetical protein
MGKTNGGRILTDGSVIDGPVLGKKLPVKFVFCRTELSELSSWTEINGRFACRVQVKRNTCGGQIQESSNEERQAFESRRDDFSA